MAFKLGDRVRETSVTTGTADFVLSGEPAGFQGFGDALSNGDTTWYAAVLADAWEVGLGTYNAGVLARTTVLASSTGSKVDFAAGTKDIFITPPAVMLERLYNLATVALSGAYADLSGRPTLGTAAAKNVGTADGQVPVLGTGGKLSSALLPAVAISDTFVVASQAAMLALSAERGDVAVRTDLNKSFILTADAPGTLANWQELLTPTDVVLSVAGLTGAVTAADLRTALALAIADITGLQEALDARAVLTADQAWTGSQRATPVALTSGTTITIALADGNDRTLTLGHNATLANPSDIASFVGQKGSIAGQQDATGGRTLSYGSFWFPIGAAAAPAVPTAANAKFRIDYHVVSATRVDFSTSKVGVA